jgi:Leucine-rich repeat (LRR) protein
MRRIIILAILLFLCLPSIAQEDEQTPYEIALQRIQEAEVSGATVLDLSGLGLTELPPEIGSLRSLETLNLENNQLTTLPPEIGNLSNLIALELSFNQLTSLPPEIGNLTNLQGLYLAFNQLTYLSPEIGRLNHLCEIELFSNELQYLPTELSQIGRIRDEDCWFSPYGNPLISPPQEVIAQGTPAILDYLENEAWWHLQRLIISAASSFGMVAAFILGMRWRNRDKRKKKHN